MKKLTINEFIKKANKIHNNNYDYSKVIYKNQDTKIKIICKKHGIFEQRPDHHLAGHNCKKCSVKSEKNVKRFINAGEFFLKEANEKWNSFYDYSKVDYKTARLKVIIICPIHGDFLQSPDAHLKHECLQCSTIKNANKQRHTTEQFIEKSKLIHKNKYDYSSVKYIGNRVKVKILCREHGVFMQTPYNHLSGKGCQHCCVLSKNEIKISNFLKENNVSFIRQKTFRKCVNPKTGKKLKFDFYLSDYNICIEYDGQQHFKSVDIWGGEKAFEDTKYRDEIKNIFCLKNDVKLIRINYRSDLFKELLHIIELINCNK